MGAIDDISYKLGEIKAQLEDLLSQAKAMNDISESLDKRVRALENRQHWYAGASAALASFGMWFVNNIIKPPH